ncbi:MAG: hypothetical protein ACXACB_01260, partial [Promethearchaeota archaeon]
KTIDTFILFDFIKTKGRYLLKCFFYFLTKITMTIFIKEGEIFAEVEEKFAEVEEKFEFNEKTRNFF